ncbi:MAG: WD40 repeat domain-containing protein [Pseudonocardiaceae bacterium]
MVEHAATEWHDDGQPPTRLWTGGQLAAAMTDTGTRRHARPAGLTTDRVDLSPKAHKFLHASFRRDRFQRRRASIVLSVLLILALVGAGVAVVRQLDAQHQLRIATARQLIAQADAVRYTDPRTALQLAIAAQRLHPGGETLARLVHTLMTTHYAGTLTGHTGSVSSVTFAPDGRTLATGSNDGTVIMWDLTSLTDLRNHAVERACLITRAGLDPGEWNRYISALPYQDTCPA